jgi:hypothetical protein
LDPTDLYLWLKDPDLDQTPDLDPTPDLEDSDLALDSDPTPDLAPDPGIFVNDKTVGMKVFLTFIA